MNDLLLIDQENPLPHMKTSGNPAVARYDVRVLALPDGPGLPRVRQHGDRAECELSSITPSRHGCLFLPPQ